MKVTIEQVNLKLMEYGKLRAAGQTEQRVGQFLMNELVPEEKDSEVFYQTEPAIAIAMFIERFVEL